MRSSRRERYFNTTGRQRRCSRRCGAVHRKNFFAKIHYFFHDSIQGNWIVLSQYQFAQKCQKKIKHFYTSELSILFFTPDRTFYQDMCITSTNTLKLSKNEKQVPHLIFYKTRFCTHYFTIVNGYRRSTLKT